MKAWGTDSIDTNMFLKWSFKAIQIQDFKSNSFFLCYVTYIHKAHTPNKKHHPAYILCIITEVKLKYKIN